MVSTVSSRSPRSSASATSKRARRVRLVPAWHGHGVPRYLTGARRPGGGRHSELPPVSRGQDDLGDDIGAQAEFVGYLLWPLSLLVVEKRQFLLRLAPRAARRRA